MTKISTPLITDQRWKFNEKFMFISPTWLEPSEETKLLFQLSQHSMLSLARLNVSEWKSLVFISPKLIPIHRSSGSTRNLEVNWNRTSHFDLIFEMHFPTRKRLIIAHFSRYYSISPIRPTNLTNIECCTSTTEPSSTHKYLEQLSIWTF